MNEQQQQKLDEILKKHEYKSNLVIAIKKDDQKEYHYLQEEAFSIIAIEFLLLKRYLVWEPVVWHRYVR